MKKAESVQYLMVGARSKSYTGLNGAVRMGSEKGQEKLEEARGGLLRKG